MYVSRFTLAMTDAIAIAVLLASPRIIVRCFLYSSGALSPPSRSTSQSLGLMLSFFIEVVSAFFIAETMPCVSISFAETIVTAVRNSLFCSFATRSISFVHTSLFYAESCLLSLIVRNLRSISLVTPTAPTATGPASGPRPTSSIPITNLGFNVFFTIFFICLILSK